MTKNRELDCTDLFECDHTLEIPVSLDGNIIYWRCRCGDKSKQVSDIEKDKDTNEDTTRLQG